MMEEAKKPLLLDVGCGKNKKPDHVGIDIIKFDGVDVVLNAGADRLPYDDGTVDGVFTSHFFEHLNAKERIHFCNEVYRVLGKGKEVTIIVPFHGSGRALGDLSHEWPPVVEFFFFYLNREWRKLNAPHLDSEFNPKGFSCHLTGTWGYSIAPKFAVRNVEFQQWAIEHYRESATDMIATLKKE